MKDKITSLEDFDVIRKERTLSNGVRLVLFEKKNSPLFITVRFLAGSRYEPNNKEGLAHFLEHMMIAGSENFPTKDLISIFIERYGGSFSLRTSPEFIIISADIGEVKDADILIEFLSQVILKPLFNEKMIETERGSIISEIGRAKTRPEYYLSKEYDDLVYKNTPYQKDIFGNEESVKKITKEDIINFYKKNITGGNCTIVASGDMSIIDLTKKIEDKFVFINNFKNLINEKPLHIDIDKKISSVKHGLSEQVLLSIGFRIGTFFVDYSPSLDIIAMTLANGRASRLVKKLRYELGLIYSIGASCNNYQDAGDFSINTTVSKEKVPEVVKIIMNEIDNIIKNGLTDEEIQFAKDKIIKSSKKEMETSRSWVAVHSYTEAIGKNGWTIVNGIDEILSITNDDIIKISQKYLSKEKVYLTFCGEVNIEKIKEYIK